MDEGDLGRVTGVLGLEPGGSAFVGGVGDCPRCGDRERVESGVGGTGRIGAGGGAGDFSSGRCGDRDRTDSVAGLVGGSIACLILRRMSKSASCGSIQSLGGVRDR